MILKELRERGKIGDSDGKWNSIHTEVDLASLLPLSRRAQSR